MESPKLLRNAQTQHGDASSVDVENIFLHRHMLYTNPTSDGNLHDREDFPECVWCPDDKDGSPAESKDPPVSSDKIRHSIKYIDPVTIIYQDIIQYIITYDPHCLLSIPCVFIKKKTKFLKLYTV